MNCLLVVDDLEWIKKATNKKNTQRVVVDEVEKFNSITVKKCLSIKYEEGFKQVSLLKANDFCFMLVKKS